jgi:hypothetical protein
MPPALKWIYVGAALLEALGFFAYLSAKASDIPHYAHGPVSIYGRLPDPPVHYPTTQTWLAAYLVFLVIGRGAALTWLGTAWATIPDGTA